MQIDLKLKDIFSGSKPVIVLVGSLTRFSDRFMSMLSEEFADHQFLRFGRMDELESTSSSMLSVEVIVFEESHVAAILSNPQAYLELAGTAQIAIAFSQAPVAAHFLKSRGCHPGLENVGLLPLNAQIEVWIAVMRLLLCGQVYLPQSVMSSFPASEAGNTSPGKTLTADEGARLHNLTAREWEVLELVATGRQNKVIANELNLSEHTVKLHIHNVLRKLGLSNRTLATRWYHRLSNAASADGIQRRG